MANNKILVVDDDPNIAQLINVYLTREGYEVETCDRGDKAVERFKTNPPNLMLLDLMLPGMDGMMVCREIRKTSNIPIIMLTAKDDTFDKVLGLELGADDYMVKPFEMKELLARIKAVLRRYQTGNGRAGQGALLPRIDGEHLQLHLLLPRQRVGHAAQGNRVALFPGEPSQHRLYARTVAGAGVGV